ncbi:MAG: hypothetical protein IPM69_04975 [Ignavibacteria bacterium]|nr:hypothetical protein [Ignavibacteria bacterium]
MNDCSRIATVKIETVLLRNGDIVLFNEDGGRLENPQDTLEYKNSWNPIADVVKVGGVEEQSSSGRTAILTVLSVLVAEYILLILFISLSIHFTLLI